MKSSSVHYHFPTKEDLAAAVVRRWTETASEHIDKAAEKDADLVRVWVKTIRGTVFSEPHMCPCTILGAAARDLPAEVAGAVKGFFDMCLKKLMAQGFSTKAATELFSTLVGAMVVANALGDTAAYDRATSELGRQRKILAA